MWWELKWEQTFEPKASLDNSQKEQRIKSKESSHYLRACNNLNMPQVTRRFGDSAADTHFV